MKSFIKKIILFSLPLILVFIIPVSVIYFGKEYYSLDKIIEIQLSNKDFMLGLVYDDISFIPYKKILVEKKKPEIIALGTSRVMQIRKEFFINEKSFVNAGGGVRNIYDLKEFIKKLTPDDNVKVIILGLDQDMLTSKEDSKSDYKNEYNSFNIWRKILFTNIRKIYIDYFHKKYTLDELMNQKGSSLVGIAAIAEGDGFREDGSYRYGNIIMEGNFENRVKQEIQNNINNIDTGRYASFKESGFESKNIEVLKSALELAKSKNIQVVGFFPPYPETAYSYMKTNDSFSNTINVLPKKVGEVFSEIGFDFVDLSNTGVIKAPSSEFVDSIHASDKMYSRIMIYLGEKKYTLKRYIEVKELQDIIEKTKGNILSI